MLEEAFGWKGEMAFPSSKCFVSVLLSGVSGMLGDMVICCLCCLCSVS